MCIQMKIHFRTRGKNWIFNKIGGGGCKNKNACFNLPPFTPEKKTFFFFFFFSLFLPLSSFSFLERMGSATLMSSLSFSSSHPAPVNYINQSSLCKTISKDTNRWKDILTENAQLLYVDKKTSF